MAEQIHTLGHPPSDGGAHGGRGARRGGRFRSRPRSQSHQSAGVRRGHGLDEEATIGALLHAARLGLFDMSWNVLCPGCGGVLEAGAALKTLNRHQYLLRVLRVDYEPTLDELVEVTFTVNPRVRRIAAHDPDTLPHPEYMRQIFWGSGIDLPDDVERQIERMTLDSWSSRRAKRRRCR